MRVLFRCRPGKELACKSCSRSRRTHGAIPTSRDRENRLGLLAGRPDRADLVHFVLAEEIHRAEEPVYSGGQTRRTEPAGDECEVDAALGGQARCSGTDDSGAAQEKNSHVKVVADRAAPTARSLLPGTARTG